MRTDVSEELGLRAVCAQSVRSQKKPKTATDAGEGARRLRVYCAQVYAQSTRTFTDLHRPSHTFTDIAQQSTRSLRAVKKSLKMPPTPVKVRVDCA